MTRLKREKDLQSDHENDVRFGTPREIAEYRAQRLCAEADTIIEVGAGAGFQTSSFAKRTANVIAIDIDESRLGRGTFDENVHIIAGDALKPETISEAKRLARGRIVIFLDPQRPARSRSRSLEEIQPDLERFVELYGSISQDMAIELPPFLSHVPWDCEHEYLSIHGQLNRHNIYLAGLKRSDVCVVALPSGARVDHSGPLPQLTPQKVDPRYILEPDRALSHAGLSAKALPERYNALHLGNRQVYLVEEPTDQFFTAYRIVRSGEKEDIIAALKDCKTVILHGALAPDEQKSLLDELNPHCTGNSRMHIFLSAQWFLCSRT